MIYVLGIDPGSISGWALVGVHITGKISLLAYGHTGKPSSGKHRAEPTTGDDIRRVLAEIGKALPGMWPPTLAIEALFLPGAAGSKGKKRHTAVGTLKAQIVTGKWIGLAEAHGCPVYEHKPGEPGVPPGVWRKSQWGKAHWPTERAKKYAVYGVASLWGEEIPVTHHHTAEAAFIASHVAGLLHLERNTKRQEKADNDRSKRNGSN